MRFRTAGDIPQEIVDKMEKQDRDSMGLRSTEEINAEIETRRSRSDKRDEAQIQNAVESYLIHLGYARRTPDDILREKPRHGWFIHLHETKRNPILLDLLIINISYGRYLELELKKSTGKASDVQEALIAYDDNATIAYGQDEAVKIIQRWHQGLFS